jgi:hypothetical protein
VTSATATPRKRGTRTPAEAPAPAPVAPEAEASSGDESGDSPALAANQASRALSIPGIQAQFTERALILPEKMTVKSWLKVVEAIDTVREGARWWFGDALLQGEERWGDTYSQALDAGKYDYATLRNLRSVAKRYPSSERIYDLSWSHYNAAMGVPLDVARELLADAFANDWSVVQLRERIKEIKSGQAVVGTVDGQTTNGTGPVPGMAVTRIEDMPGIKPIDDPDAYMTAGKTVFDCGGCDYVFAEQVWHCVGCGGHWSISEDECPNEACGDGLADSPAPSAATGPTLAPSTRTVTGTVVPPAGSSDDTDRAILVLASFPYADLDPSDIAASLVSSDAYPDVMAQLMATHNWLGQVIEAMAAKDDEPEAPGRDAEIEDEESEDEDGLGELFGDDESAEDDDESDDGEDEAEDDDTASESTLTASETASAATRTGAWSTKGADVVPPASPAASKPLSPAPKPGTGKPVRRRAKAAAS